MEVKKEDIEKSYNYINSLVNKLHQDIIKYNMNVEEVFIDRKKEKIILKIKR